MPTCRSVLKTASRCATLIGLLLALLLPSGCAPSSREVSDANFGPAPDHCERRIQQQIDLTVFSGRPGEYIFTEPPYKASVNRSLFAKAEFGWIVEFQAKGNIALGTGGYRTYHYFFLPDGNMALLTTDASIHRISD